MIYTVTFNPSIDYVVHTSSLALGAVNRSEGEAMYFGGKGINVSVVLRELGFDSRALGFVAGFTGEAIENGLRQMGITTDLVRLKEGCSRINVKIKSAEETDLNGMGPAIDADSLDMLLEKLDKLTEGDTLILAGSIPKGMPSDIYERILARLSGRGIRFVVDATGDLLLNVLKYKPFLVKPNSDELGEMFGLKLTDEEQIIEYARRLKDMGAENVLVSRAGAGALLLAADGKTYSHGVCKGTVRNSVGAGDSMVAGFIAGILGSEDYDSAAIDYGYALSLGTAAGGATAFSDGLATKDKIEELLKQM